MTFLKKIKMQRITSKNTNWA